MSVRKAVYEVLDLMEVDTVFYGWQLKNWSKIFLDGKEDPYTSTVLRDLRKYRVNNRNVKCINIKQSLYRMEGD